MDRLRQGWFSEVNELWPGQAMSLEVEEILLHEKSKFQDVMVFKRYSEQVLAFQKSWRRLSLPCFVCLC